MIVGLGDRKWYSNGFMVKETRTPDLPSFDITYRILHPIELPLIPKPIGDRKWYNNGFMVRVGA